MLRIRPVARGLLLALALSLATIAPARANDLVVGLATPLTSLDPHFHNLTPNNAAAQHVFDALTDNDENMNVKPSLAESWKAINDTTWEVKLRKNVKWHDGKPFTAEDVIATFKRVPNVPRSPSSFATFTKPIKDIKAPDPHTLILTTAAPHPLLPNDLTSVYIVPKAIAETATTDDFNSGKAMVGTGPFRFAEYRAGDRLVLKRNDAYWGAKPAWTNVQLRMITNASARVAAMLAGDVHMIENVPTADIERIRANKSLAVAQATSNRVIYLHLDSGREKNSPFVRTKDGQPMEANPLRDPRVRQAISIAINRDAIVDRIMEKVAEPAGQLLSEKFFGTSPKLKPPKYDVEGAKKLLAAAGYPNGFQLTLHSPNNRYINDEKVAQAVAQFLTRAGIETKLETMPSNIFFSRGSNLEFSLLLAGWGSSSGDTSSPLRALLATYDKDQGMGSANRGRFSNAGLDAMISTALVQIDDTKRKLLLAAASERAMELAGIIPLHYEVSVWGTRANIQYTARADQYTLAHSARPAK